MSFISNLGEAFISRSERGTDRQPANVVDGLFEIATSIRVLAKAIDRLGTANANTPMGAIELLSSEVKRIADTLEETNS